MPLTLSRKSWVIAIGILVIALIIAGVVVWRVMSSRSPAGQEKGALLQNAPLTISSPSFTKGIALIQLPSSFNFFILKNATATTVQAVKYQDGSLGYVVSYMMSGAILPAYQEMLNSMTANKWQILKGSRSDLFAYADAHVTGYEARTEFSEAKAGIVVKITIAGK